MKTVTDGVHLFGPHRIRFWPGNYAPLAKRFQAALPGQDDPTYSDARRFVDG